MSETPTGADLGCRIDELLPPAHKLGLLQALGVEILLDGHEQLRPAPILVGAEQMDEAGCAKPLAKGGDGSLKALRRARVELADEQSHLFLGLVVFVVDAHWVVACVRPSAVAPRP